MVASRNFRRKSSTVNLSKFTLIFTLLFSILTAPAMLRAANIQYTTNTLAFRNPERGFYSVGLDNSSITNLSTNYAFLRSQGVSLVYSRVDLSSFTTSSISAGFLQDMNSGFALIRAQGLKSIVRITYNDGLPPSGPPGEADLAQLTLHLQQLEPVFEANKDVIAFFQAGIIGAWGEWHSTAEYITPPDTYEEYNMPDAPNRLAVVNALLTYIPEGRFVQIRRPWFKDPDYGSEALYPGEQVDDASAFTNTPLARVGHHNDCFLASATDFGTYQPGNIPEQKAFLNSDTRYVPLGGETCNPDFVYANCTNALAEMEYLRYTYLNLLYHPDVIDEFENAGCFDEIERRLGYRYELLSANLPDDIVNTSTFSYTITLNNVGFAPLYNERKAYLLILDGSTILQEVELSSDPRRWLPGEPQVISGSATANIAGTLPANVDLALWLPDMDEDLEGIADYSIRFANDSVWDDTHGWNVLATGIPLQEPASVSEFWTLD